MKIQYSPDVDVLVIRFRESNLADSVDLKEGVILHLDDKGEALEIEVLDASKKMSLNEITFSGNVIVRP